MRKIGRAQPNKKVFIFFWQKQNTGTNLQMFMTSFLEFLFVKFENAI